MLWTHYKTSNSASILCCIYSIKQGQLWRGAEWAMAHPTFSWHQSNWVENYSYNSPTVWEWWVGGICSTQFWGYYTEASYNVLCIRPWWVWLYLDYNLHHNNLLVSQTWNITWSITGKSWQVHASKYLLSVWCNWGHTNYYCNNSTVVFT